MFEMPKMEMVEFEVEEIMTASSAATSSFGVVLPDVPV